MRLYDELEKVRGTNDPQGIGALIDRLSKKGARFSDKDTKTIQGIHDDVANLCDKVHCARGANWQGSPNNQPGDLPDGTTASMMGPDAKAGARHSNADMMHLKAIHDSAVACGAECGD